MQNSHIGGNALIVSVSAQSLETCGCNVSADLKHKSPTEQAEQLFAQWAGGQSFEY
jgi:hypothetical protein